MSGTAPSRDAWERAAAAETITPPPLAACAQGPASAKAGAPAPSAAPAHSQALPKALPESATGVPPAFTSSELMQGHRTIAIRHNGITYRLQATRQGKLILTK